MSDLNNTAAPAEGATADTEKTGDSKIPGVIAMRKHVDKNDPDEALKLVAAHEGEAIVLSPEAEKKLLRKIDLHLMPLLCVVYGLNYLDKTTLSYASVMGIKNDIHIGVNQYNWVASIFYFGYLFWEWPTNRLLQRLPLAKYSAFNVITWGLVLCCMAAVKNFAGAMTVRFFLGVFEAAVSPGFALFTSQWYTIREQGTRVAWWFSFNGWAQIIGGCVAYGIAVGTERHPLLITSWQLIFLVTGFFTAFMGALFLYLMPDSQLNARFLTPRSESWPSSGFVSTSRAWGISTLSGCKEAFTDPMIWAFVLYSLFSTVPNGGISNYFSQLIVSFGFTNNESLLLGAPGGVVQIITLLACGHLGDRFKNRILFSSCGILLAIIGLLLIRLLPEENKAGRLVGYYLYQSLSTGFVVLLGLISTNVAGWTKKTTSAAMYLIAYCVGNIIGPQVFRPQDAPEYINAITVVLACTCVAWAVLIFVYYWCRRQNQVKAAIRDSPGYEKVGGQEFMDLTDRENPEFIYSL